MAASFAYVANTNNLELTGLKSDEEDIFLNDVTITVTIKEGSATGDDLGGSTGWPLSMTYVAASDGNYIVGLSHTLPFVNGAKYVAIIDADASDTSAERYGHWEFPFTGKTRTS